MWEELANRRNKSTIKGIGWDETEPFTFHEAWWNANRMFERRKKYEIQCV